MISLLRRLAPRRIAPSSEEPATHVPAMETLTTKIRQIDKASAVKRAADMIGFFVVITGLYLTYTEARRANAGQNLENWSQVSSITFEMDKVLIEHPAYQKYIFDGKVIKKGEKDYDRALAISVMYLDYFDSVTSRIEYNQRYLTNDILQKEAWYHYIGETLSTAPLMCEILLTDPESYGTEMRRVGVPPCKRFMPRVPGP